VQFLWRVCVVNQTKFGAQKGFTLFEMAISMAIVATVFSCGILAWSSYVHMVRVKDTQERMDQVLNAFSTYAQRYYRLPCPAEPNGDGSEKVAPPPHNFQQNCLGSRPIEYGFTRK
jgi:prepilin-type N-terminal cleavage/methylation domain-containing protein